MDLGKYFLDGRRILGDGKSIEGFCSGTLAGFLTGLLLTHLHVPEYVGLELPLTPLASLILALGAMVGDVLGSFIKRRLGIPRGKPAPLLDQLSFLLVALLLYHLIIRPVPLVAYLILVLITPILHLSTNYVAYLLKLKEVPY